MVSASSLETPSLIGLGAPSTRSLASFKPRLVTSRTALITLILLAPTPVRMTLNSVFSSAGAAPAAAPAPPPAIMTGAAAAAETPKRSSSFFTSCAASSSDSPTICSSNCCKSAIAISTLRYQFCCSVPCARFPVRSRTPARARHAAENPDRNPWHLITKSLCSGGFLAGKLVLLHALVDHYGQVAPHGVHGRDQPLRGGIDQEQQLGVNLLARRHGGQRLDLLGGDDAAVQHAQLEGKLRGVLDVLGNGLSQGHRSAGRIGDGVHALQALQGLFHGRALGGALGQGVLDHPVLATGAANRLAQL